MDTAVLEAKSSRRVRVEALAWFALAGVVVYVAIDVLLKFLRPGYSLLYNAESDYGRGPWYWVMDLNFLLRCAVSLAVAVALSRAALSRAALSRAPRLDGRARAGVALLVTWAICSGLLAFFADDLEGQPVHGSGAVHIVLALIAFPCVAIGAILISVSLRSDPDWRSAGAVLLGVSIAGAAAFLLLGTAFGHKHAPGGLYERIFLGIEMLWIALAAGYVIARRPAATEAPAPVTEGT